MDQGINGVRVRGISCLFVMIRFGSSKESTSIVIKRYFEQEISFILPDVFNLKAGIKSKSNRLFSLCVWCSVRE